MIALLVAVVGESPGHHLLLTDVFKVQKLVVVLSRRIVEAIRSGTACLGEEARLVRQR